MILSIPCVRSLSWALFSVLTLPLAELYQVIVTIQYWDSLAILVLIYYTHSKSFKVNIILKGHLAIVQKVAHFLSALRKNFSRWGD